MSKHDNSSNPENRPRNETEDAEEDDSEADRNYSSAHYSKAAVHHRDQNACLDCGETFSDISNLDVDHIVPEGVGGANTVRNKASLCRRCHEAKHGEREHAPTIRCTSTGDMIQKDFEWFKLFWQDLLPALSSIVLDTKIKPKRDLDDNTPYQAWHIPIGDLRRLSEVLGNRNDVQYVGHEAYRFM